MAGGQQLNAGQGTVLGGPSQAVSGSEATSAAGTAPVAALVRLASRKVGGGTATFPLSGQAVLSTVGTLLGGPGQVLGGAVVTGATGSLTRSVARLVSGSAVLTAAGTLSASGGSANNITTFTLTRASVGSSVVPFHEFALGFKDGDVPASFVVTNLSTYQVNVLRRWDSGAVKHAMISGRANLTQTTPLTLNIGLGTPPTGSVTRADIPVGLRGVYSFQAGSFGTATIDLINDAATQRIDGPEMGEFRFFKDIGSGVSISVDVRVFKNDASIALFWEFANDYWDNGAGVVNGGVDRSFVPTVTLNGAVVFTNGNASLTLPYKSTFRSPVSASGWHWLGRSDPQVQPLHEMAYQRSTRLVMNCNNAPPTAYLNSITADYVPISIGLWRLEMHSEGYSPMIGVHTKWDAAYIATADARAWKAMVVNVSNLNSYACCFRDFTTKKVPKLSSWATWTILGNFQGGRFSHYNSLGSEWEIAHFGAGGYIAYLFTGSAHGYDVMMRQAWMCYCSVSEIVGDGVNRLVRDKLETRGYAWVLRSVGMAAALSTDTDIAAGGIGKDFRDWLGNNIANDITRVRSNAADIWSGLGQIEWQDGGGVIPDMSPWMNHFQVAAKGFISDIQALPATNRSILEVRDWMYRWTIGLLGKSGDPSQFDFTQAIPYRVTLATSRTSGVFYQTWGEIFQATKGTANNVVSNTLSVQGGVNTQAAWQQDEMQGYWGVVWCALQYALAHRAEGALLALQRLQGATNYTFFQNALGYEPHWGTSAHAVTPTALEAAFQSLSPGQCRKLGTTLPGSMLYFEGDDILQWANSACYSHREWTVNFVGKMQGNTVPYHYLRYDERTNTWSNPPTWAPGVNQTGHGYDHNALEPMSGTFYHREYATPNVRIFNPATSTWSQSSNWSGLVQAAGGLTWCDGIGLTYLDAEDLRLYNALTNTWSVIAHFGVDSYHQFSEWNPIARRLIGGGGNGDGPGYKMMDGYRAITNISTPPFELGVAENQNSAEGMGISDPASPKMLALGRNTAAGTNGLWREYSINTNSWSNLTTSVGNGASPQNGMPPITEGDTSRIVAAPIPRYSGTMWIKTNGPSNNADVWIVKNANIL